MTHEERVTIAEELARRIVQTYGDAVLAVFITSSTAKGLDRPHSDLELTAVLRTADLLAMVAARGVSLESETLTV